MKKYFLLGLVLLWGLCPQQGFATPPETLDIQYSLDAQTLTLSGRHPTQHRLEHFIRRMIVTRNQEEPQKFYLTRQDSASEFKTTVPLKLEPGDMIKIETLCSQGGGKSAEFQVPEIVVQENVPAEDLKTIKDNAHQNMPIIP